MSDLQFKTIDIEVGKETGQVRSLIGRTGETDRQGDFSMPGFVGQSQTVHMKWNHGLPFVNGLTIGKGTVGEKGKDVVFDGLFNLKMETGREVHEQVLFDLNNPPALQEWSYGWMPLGKMPAPVKSMPQGTQRVLSPLQDGSPGISIKEVSPVSLAGAGNDTQTLEVKSQDGMQFDDHAAFTSDVLDGFAERAEALAALRAKDGRNLSEANLKALTGLGEHLERITKLADGLQDSDDDDRIEALRVERNRFLRTLTS